MKRIAGVLATLLVLVLLSLTAVSATGTVHKTRMSGTFSAVPAGYAFATYLTGSNGSGNTNTGPSVPVALSCVTRPNSNTITNSGPALSESTLLGSGNSVSTITINRSATQLKVQTSEEIQNLKLFGGMIAAQAVHAIVTSTSTRTNATSTNSSVLNGLTIAGLPVNSRPAPNTTRTLPGLGSVILNEQSGPSNGSTTTSIGVILMDVHITSPNAFGLAVGTRVIIAYAQSAVMPAAVSAIAYSLYRPSSGSTTPAIGQLALAGISCQGGSSTASANQSNSPSLGSTGSESSSASGQVSASGATANASNSTSNVNLYSGLVSAQHVVTVAHAAWSRTGSRSGSATLTGGKLDGTTLPANPAPNTRENLPGIGYALINEQYGSNTSSGASETVIGIDIYVTVANNSLGLPEGARIIVSSASAGATSS